MDWKYSVKCTCLPIRGGKYSTDVPTGDTNKLVSSSSRRVESKKKKNQEVVDKKKLQTVGDRKPEKSQPKRPFIAQIIAYRGFFHRTPFWSVNRTSKRKIQTKNAIWNIEHFKSIQFTLKTNETGVRDRYNIVFGLVIVLLIYSDLLKGDVVIFYYRLEFT